MISRLSGGILLLVGTCVGVGMLGLPVVTRSGGFIPSSFLFVFVCLFMMVTGLLLLEANLQCGEKVSITSIAQLTLGKWGKVVAASVYLFLFYSLMVAYISKGGEVVQEVSLQLFPSFEGSFFNHPYFFSTFFMILYGAIVFWGTRCVDWINRWMMLGLIMTYFLLVFAGMKHVKVEHLIQGNWSVSFIAAPIMVASFGFHNIVPTLVDYFHGQRKKLYGIIIVGSLATLGIYLFWELVILGITPFDHVYGTGSGEIAIQSLKKATQGSSVSVIALYFAYFAISTSFLGVAISFVDFLADFFSKGKSLSSTPLRRAGFCFLALCPPYLFALAYPQVFITALNYAGGMGAVILFGILPVLMIWKGKVKISNFLGRKGVLAVIFLLACLILFLEIAMELGWLSSWLSFAK